MSALTALSAYAETLLSGTGFDVDAALAVARDGGSTGGVCGEALAEGWACGEAVALVAKGGDGS